MSELKEIEEFTQQLRMLGLGDLIDKLISIKLDDINSEEDSITKKSERTLKKSALKKEISKREVGREDTEDTSSVGGVTSLGNLF